MKNIKLENLGDKLVVELGLQDSALTVKILGKYLCYLCLTELSKVIDEIPKNEEVLLDSLFSKEERSSIEFELTMLAEEWSNDLADLFLRSTARRISCKKMFEEIYSVIEKVTEWKWVAEDDPQDFPNLSEMIFNE